MNTAEAEAVARAVLYKGFVLYPDRAAAIKNRQRRTAGQIFPRDFAVAAGSDPFVMQTQCLVRGSAPIIDLKVRFLHAVERELGILAQPAASLPDGEPAFRSVPLLELNDRHFVAWQEAAEREIPVAGFTPDEWLNGAAHIPFAFPSLREMAPIRRADGMIAAVELRTTGELAGELILAAEAVAPDAYRVTVRIENTWHCEPCEVADRNYAQRRAFALTHTILAARGASFVSLLAPPEELKDAARNCNNQGTWPVLVGEPGQTDLVLSSPIILCDYPQPAPESPGDFFDGGAAVEDFGIRGPNLTDARARWL